MLVFPFVLLRGEIVSNGCSGLAGLYVITLGNEQVEELYTLPLETFKLRDVMKYT